MLCTRPRNRVSGPNLEVANITFSHMKRTQSPEAREARGCQLYSKKEKKMRFGEQHRLCHRLILEQLLPSLIFLL